MARQIRQMSDATLKEAIEGVKWFLDDPDSYRVGADAYGRAQDDLRAMRAEQRRRRSARRTAAAVA